MTKEDLRVWKRRYVELGRATLAELRAGRDAREVSWYAIRHFGAHIEDVGELDLAHELVDPDWERGWEAVEGSGVGFHDDVERAWAALGKQANPVAAERDWPTFAARACRCALVVASAETIAHAVPLLLVAGLYEAGVWSAGAAMSHVRRSGPSARPPDLERLGHSLAARGMQREALETVQAIADPALRDLALARIAEAMSEWARRMSPSTLRRRSPMSAIGAKCWPGCAAVVRRRAPARAAQCRAERRRPRG